jgi:TctA family transporter
LRQSLLMSSGSFDIFFFRPISGVIMLIAIILLTMPLLHSFNRMMRLQVSRWPL